MNLYESYALLHKETEAPAIFHRWSLITAVGAYLGRRCWFPFGSGRIFPNVYCMLVGNPGARKSTAIKASKRLLASAGYTNFASEKTSKEKFILDLAGSGEGEGINLFAPESAAEILVAADEFNEFVGSNNVEFLSMLGALWDWDDDTLPYRSRFKNAKSVEIMQPTISILGGNTHAGFSEAFSLNTIGQGFMSRLILVHSEPTGRKITIPKPLNQTLFADTVGSLSRIRDTVHGEMTISDEAYSAIDGIYKTWPDLEDQRFKHYSTRRLTHLLKLCIINAAIDYRTEIKVKDVFLGNTILAYTERSMPKAMGEIGKKKTAAATGIVMNMLYDTRKPLEFMTLWRAVQHELEGIRDLQNIIQSLLLAEKIQSTGSAYLPKVRPTTNKLLYVDYDLLNDWELAPL